MPNKLCTYSAVTLFTELTLMFFFLYRIGLMYWNLKEKKKRVYQTSGALKTVIFSIFGKIVKNDFSSFSPLPMKSTHELSSKNCFSSP